MNGWDKARTLSVKYRNFIPSVIILLCFITAAIFAPVLPLPDPLYPDMTTRNQAPGIAHWLGTDPNGMDVFSRIIFAMRIDFGIAVMAVLMGIVVGAPLGAVTAYQGGLVENLIERIAEMIQSFPIILFAMLASLLFGKGMWTLVFVLAFSNAPFYAKIARSITKPLREADFIAAARCSGQKTRGIILRHLLPNAFPGVLSQFPLSCASAIRTVAALSFVGLGVSLPTPEWGSMIYIGANYVVFGKWWSSTFPGLALLLAVWVLTSLGEQLQTLYRREG